MGISLSHLIVILLIVLLVFGAGKLPKIMSDLAKGLKAFKDELNNKDDDRNVIKEIDNLKLNSSDSFCQSHLGDSAKLEQSCGQLTEDKCQQIKCCIWTKSTNNTEKCMAGDQNGPTYTDNLKTMTAYYWQGIKHDVGTL
jgi:sec-independent protein translocase protein TatA